MQHDMRHSHLDLGQLNHPVRMTGRRFGKLLLTAGTNFWPDLDDRRGFQPRLAMAGVPWLGARSPLRARAGDPLCIRWIGRGGTIGVLGVLGHASFEHRDALCLLVDHIEQMHDHLAYDERGLFPSSGIQ
jgi:hypothetical protein